MFIIVWQRNVSDVVCNDLVKIRSFMPLKCILGDCRFDLLQNKGSTEKFRSLFSTRFPREDIPSLFTCIHWHIVRFYRLESRRF